VNLKVYNAPLTLASWLCEDFAKNELARQSGKSEAAVRAGL
jgi:hypothetical protein